MSEQVLAALRKLDVNKDDQWTIEGDPKLDIVKQLSNDQTVDREMLKRIAPGFNREAYRAYLAQNPQEVANATTAGIAGGAGGVATAPSSATQEPAAADEGPENREAEVEALAAEIASQDEAILELQRLQDETGKKLTAEIAKRDELAARRDKLIPPETTGSVIAQYLERQKENLRLRGEAIAAVRASGVDLKALAKLTSGSPIDARFRATRRSPAHLPPARS